MIKHSSIAKITGKNSESYSNFEDGNYQQNFVRKFPH